MMQKPEPEKHKENDLVCRYRNADQSEGIYGDNEWMCGGGIAAYQSKF